MINSKIIKIASSTNNAGLKNRFTHKSSVKNSLCGDIIKTEFIADKTKIRSMRYETKSCVLCEASASLLAKKIKNKSFKDICSLKKFYEIKKSKRIIFPVKFKEFNKLLDKNNLGRIDCVILPIEALFKAFKIKR